MDLPDLGLLKLNGIAIIISKKNIIMGQSQLDISDEIIKIVDSKIKPFTLK